MLSKRGEVRCSRRISIHSAPQTFFPGDKWNIEQWKDLVKIAKRRSGYVRKHGAEVLRKATLFAIMILMVNDKERADGQRL